MKDMTKFIIAGVGSVLLLALAAAGAWIAIIKFVANEFACK